MYYFERNGEKIYTTEEYYFECFLRDRFLLVHKNKEGDKIFDDDKQLTNTVSYKMNLVDSEDGIAIPLPDNVVQGELTFELYRPNHLGKQPCYATDGGSAFCYAFHFSDLSLKYTTDKYSVNMFTGKKYELDQKYENEIDSDNVTEFEDIELRINTYNEHAGSYSYVISKTGNKYDYVGELLNKNTSKSTLSEEHIIDKYSKYYSTPKLIYNNTLKDADKVTPLTKYYENTLDTTFIGNTLIYNLSNNSVDVTINENDN